MVVVPVRVVPGPALCHLLRGQTKEEEVLFAGFLRIPITSVFMVIEVSGSYSAILPVMVSNMIAYLISRRYSPVPLFDMLARQDGIILPSLEDLREQALLEGGPSAGRLVANEEMRLLAVTEQLRLVTGLGLVRLYDLPVRRDDVARRQFRNRRLIIGRNVQKSGS